MDLITVTRAYNVLAVELDTGTLFLAATPGLLGRDQLLPIVVEWGQTTSDGAEIVIERAGLPAEARDAWWTNREAAVLTVEPDAGSAYDGSVVFDGVIATEPDDEGGLLRLRLIPPRRRVVAIPDYGLVTADTWPLAPDAAMGKVKPMIVGTVENCPLLPVRLPAATRLERDANPGDGQLEVEDAAALAAFGTVMVDGHTYAYDAKSSQGNTLLGVTVVGCHRQGTAVVTAGDTVYLAAGHACTAIADLRSGGSPIAGGSVNLSAATITFAAPPLQTERSERFTLQAQFDQIGSGTTALNAINAIRAITSTVNQSASSLPGVVTAATQNAVIVFARPAGRIVKGVYTVAFSVAIGAQIGWARVRIGNEVVWMMEPPASVLYSWSPATILFDDDSDVLPVVVEVAEGGSADQVGVTIVSASRVASLGNLDDGNFATLKGPSNLLWRADQTDAMPDRGPIAKARLWLRWFANGTAALPAATVKFGGRTLGKLEQTQLANATLSHTVAIDSVTQGSVAIPGLSVPQAVTGGVGALSHASIPRALTITPNYVAVPGSSPVVNRAWARVPIDEFDNLVGSIAVSFVVISDVQPLSSGSCYLRRANGSNIAIVDINTGNPTEVATNSYQYTTTISEAPAQLFWDDLQQLRRIGAITFSWNSQTTLDAVSQTNNLAVNQQQNTATASTVTSGVAVTLADGGINFTVPAPPRVVDSFFDLSWVRAWPDLVGQAEVAYTAGGPDLCLNQVALLVEYDAQVLGRAETLTATVTGLSGNPADVIALLAGKTGQKCDPQALGRLRAWCDVHAYTFGRRIGETTDSLTALSQALSQVNALPCQRDGRLAPMRRLDVGSEVTTIRDSDLLRPAHITWAEQIENAISLRYRPSYTEGRAAVLPGGAAGDYTRALVADASGNAYCRQSQAAIREVRAIEIAADWLRDDASAARFVADVARLNARPRRVLELACTFAQQLAEGDLIEYLPPGAAPGEGFSARITAVSLDGPWPTLTAEQILD